MWWQHELCRKWITETSFSLQAESPWVDLVRGRREEWSGAVLVPRR